MSTISKERVAEFIKNPLDNGLTRGEQIELARIALASLEAEAVAWRYRHHNGLAPSNWKYVDSEVECNPAPKYQRQALYTAPPAPVSVPDELTREEYKRRFMEDDDFDDTFRGGWKAHRAAMLQGAEPVSNRDELTDAVNGLLAVMDEYPETLVPINRDSAVVRQLRVAAGD
ncbi:TPA: hypothetical protein U2Q59_002059 [Enterobacter hormaechei]|nr:hypothetical protein [Enterobacter hormaechei]